MPGTLDSRPASQSLRLPGTMECVRLSRRHGDLLKLEGNPWCVRLHPSDDETHYSVCIFIWVIDLLGIINISIPGGLIYYLFIPCAFLGNS